MRRELRGFGDDCQSLEHITRQGWQKQRAWAVDADDECLTWPERELIRRLGMPLHGKTHGQEGRHD